MSSNKHNGEQKPAGGTEGSEYHTKKIGGTHRGTARGSARMNMREQGYYR